jgi:Cd2+/Zn2+-exporting ATPase
MGQSGYTNVTLITDGASEGLYLPEIKKASDGSMEDVVVYEDESNSESMNHDDSEGGSTNSNNLAGTQQQNSNPSNNKNDNDDNEDDNTAIRMELHVILSGLFWAISMMATLAPTSSNWRYLEYAGLFSVLFGLPPVLRKAINTLRRLQFDANCMMATAAIGACILGEWDEAASVSFLFSVSDYMELRASSRARRALQAIIQLRPDHATVIDEVTKDISIVPAMHVPIHALLSVRTGDKIAADGIVVEGTSSIDQSSLTGESRPVQVTVGSTVSGGSINIGATPLHIRTTASVQDSAVSRLIRLVEDAQSNRSPTEKLVDTFARAYTPAVVGMAMILATIPWFWGIEMGRTWSMNALILIVIACPCALTISTPVTYAAGLAATAQRGIVCKGGATLEALGNVQTIIFDKTGTLTEGKFIVTNLQNIGTSMKRNEMLEHLALMEMPSSHPLASTLIQAVKSEGVTIPSNATVREHTLLPGEGVTALINNRNVYVGNRRLFERLGMYQDLPIENKHIVDQWEVDQGGTVGFIGVEGIGIVGSYCATDVVRLEAKETVQAFLSSGFDVLMLTGDGAGAAKSVARQVGIPESAVHSQLLPEDKLSFVTKLKSTTNENDESDDTPSINICQKERKVLFCGDGVNDAPALAFADVGISMGEGAALAMEMSDVTLMDSNLSKLQYVIHVGSRVLQTIRENIIISLLCKFIVIALTFGGYMTLLLAIASDVGVMLLVTFNGMKLLPRSDAAVVSLDDEKVQSSHGRRQRYERLSTEATDASNDNVELV